MRAGGGSAYDRDPRAHRLARADRAREV